eukprot:GHRR01017374.1.p6 GENE.GHRR01017374.1~~GHRR01017374.1.p6  ORF type:complete len:101 (+),score=32.73 GHRR01017374.1:1345-1647(+)
MVVLAVVYQVAQDDLAGVQRPSLTHIQVGLSSPASGLKQELDDIEVVFALKRSPSYCLHGNADQQSCNDKSKLETIFNSASLNERAKFEKETFVKVGGKV